MRVVVIDGQGGSLGRAVVERLRAAMPALEIIAVGTNSAATTAMLRAGATAGATGANAVAVVCADADVIAGPIGILEANALLGEVTPGMAVAVGRSRAHKVLIPVSRCGITVVGARELPFAEYVELAAAEIGRLCAE